LRAAVKVAESHEGYQEACEKHRAPLRVAAQHKHRQEAYI
jgi:hypothetical protein